MYHPDHHRSGFSSSSSSRHHHPHPHRTHHPHAHSHRRPVRTHHPHSRSTSGSSVSLSSGSGASRSGTSVGGGGATSSSRPTSAPRTNRFVSSRSSRGLRTAGGSGEGGGGRGPGTSSSGATTVQLRQYEFQPRFPAGTYEVDPRPAFVVHSHSAQSHSRVPPPSRSSRSGGGVTAAASAAVANPGERERERGPSMSTAAGSSSSSGSGSGSGSGSAGGYGGERERGGVGVGSRTRRRGGGATTTVTRSGGTSDPERLNLDRAGLKEIPSLRHSASIQLLNLQYNNIMFISNLRHLPNLMFLDLYENSIRRIANLHHCGNLRVLMLGKNLIEKIEGLDRLRGLDVLDLHGNKIRKIEGVLKLRRLRVLNLAGNRLPRVESGALRGLVGLQELNLRRNRIETVGDGIEALSVLRKVYLSKNRIRRIGDVGPLLRSMSVLELGLDLNPITEFPLYRKYVVENLRQLKVLDGQEVSESDRLQRDTDADRHSHQYRAQEGVVSDVADAAPASVSSSEKGDSSQGQDQGRRRTGEPPSRPTPSVVGRGDAEVEAPERVASSSSSSSQSSTTRESVRDRMFGMRNVRRKGTSTGSGSSGSSDQQPKGSAAQRRALNVKSSIRSKCLTIDQQHQNVLVSEYYSVIEEVRFSGVDFGHILSYYLPKLRKFQVIQSLIFDENGINSLAHFRRFQLPSHLIPKIVKLRITNNPVSSLSPDILVGFWTLMFPNIRNFNGIEIIKKKIASDGAAAAEPTLPGSIASNSYFDRFSIFGRRFQPVVEHGKPSDEMETSRRDLDRTKRKTSSYVARTLSQALVIYKKMKVVDRCWDDVVTHLIEETLQDL